MKKVDYYEQAYKCKFWVEQYFLSYLFISSRRLIGQVQEIQKLEQEGAYAWFTDPAVAGHTYEDTEEYIKGTKL